MSYIDKYGVIYSDNRKILVAAPKPLTEYVIPDGVERIRSKAFYSQSGLRSIVVAHSVRKIGDGAFASCPNLVDFELLSPQFILKDGALYDMEFSRLICYMSAISTSSKFVIPEGVRTICDNAFSNSTKLEEVIIPRTLMAIKCCAFSCCASLRSVTASGDDSDYFWLSRICCHAFFRCEQLLHIDLPTRDILISECAFLDCNILTPHSPNISYENWCEYMDDTTQYYIYVMYDASRHNRTLCDHTLSMLIIPEDVTEIEEGAFIGCSKLSELIIYSPHFVCEDGILYNRDKSVIVCALRGYDHFEDLEIAPSVERIGEYAFANLYFESVILPSSLRSIGKGAFEYCYYLEKVVMPDSEVEIGEEAFEGCELLEICRLGDEKSEC